MNRRLAIAAFLLALSPALAQAQPWDDPGRPSFGAEDGAQDRAREAVRSGRQVPLARVLRQIAQRYPGRHLNVMPGDAGGRAIYSIQWQFPDGRVVIFVVDAESGAIISGG